MEHLPAPAPAMDLRLDLARAMRHLSTAEQAVLLHCVQLGMSHEEAAYVLAMPLGTVKTHAMRGKAKLRTRLAAWHKAAGEGRTP
jgi:DNA-directed RNA polymerase specialized sigma24 family protein